MGSGDWFKNIIKLKKGKDKNSRRDKGKGRLLQGSTDLINGTAAGNSRVPDLPVEYIAATRIQNAFRSYLARRTLRRLRGIVRLQVLAQNYPIKKQANSTLGYLHSWSNIQTQIRDRRLSMVAEGRLKQKKLENQLKLEAKLHDLEFEWCGGSETMEEILARIHKREEAAVKRERAMAYAFSHQWRANPSLYYGLGKDELGNPDWGWSWTERWIAARPWESRVHSRSWMSKKPPSKQTSKVGKSTTVSTPNSAVSVKKTLPNGRGKIKPRRLSYSTTDIPVVDEKANKVEGNARTEQTLT